MNEMLGRFLVTVAIVLLSLSFILILTPAVYYAIFAAILALVPGIIGFDYLVAASQPKPILPVAFEWETFGTVLRSGIGIQVAVEITISPPPEPSSRALDRIRVRMQGALNLYASKIDEISAEPFPEFERVFNAAIQPLCGEMGIGSIEIRTMDVKLESAPLSPTRGIYFRE